jgi:hypothetical protein
VTSITQPGAGHPVELLHSERAEKPREAFHGNGRCGIDPFANGGGYTEAIAKSIAVRTSQFHQLVPAGKEPQSVFKHRCPLGNHPTANGFILWRQFGAFCAAPQTTSRIFAMPNFTNLPPFTADGDVPVVVEIPVAGNV